VCHHSRLDKVSYWSPILMDISHFLSNTLVTSCNNGEELEMNACLKKMSHGELIQPPLVCYSVSFTGIASV